MWADARGSLRRNLFPISAGLICFAYAALAWLTVTPNQDILADGIQAQSLITDPRLVLAFPGQKHGGPLEYPYTVLAEWLFPGNYFANAGIRPILAFATGFVVAKLFISLFPRAPHWSLLLAMAAGPAVMHAYTGPKNAFGVIWLQPNYDMSWLLVSLGALILSRLQDSATPSWRRGIRGALLAGLALGLGFYAHPNITILLVPLVVLVLLLTPQKLRSLAWVMAGGVIGAIPAAVSYVVNARVNTWDPSHKPFIALDFYRVAGPSVLGLDGIPDHTRAVLPYALGLPPDQSLLSGPLQSAITASFLLVIFVLSIASTVRAVVGGKRISQAGALSIAWLSVVGVLFLFITFVDAVWLYSPQLSVLLWLSIGALPSLVRPPVMGAFVTLFTCLALLAATSWHGRSYFPHLPQGFMTKVQTQERLKQLANELSLTGVQYVYGSYLDVIPVAYASGFRLQPVSNRYNRFPVGDGEATKDPRVVVAVNLLPTDDWGREALRHLETDLECDRSAQMPIEKSSYGVFLCSVSALGDP